MDRRRQGSCATRLCCSSWHRHRVVVKSWDSIVSAGAATKFRRLSKKIYVFRLIASLPTAIPLRLQYGSGEPNSASLWLERWSRSHFREPLSEPKKNPDSKSRRSEEDKSKKSVRRISGANAENGSACSTLDYLCHFSIFHFSSPFGPFTF